MQQKIIILPEFDIKIDFFHIFTGPLENPSFPGGHASQVEYHWYREIYIL
jgi:hypothetical protein